MTTTNTKPSNKLEDILAEAKTRGFDKTGCHNIADRYRNAEAEAKRYTVAPRYNGHNDNELDAFNHFIADCAAIKAYEHMRKHDPNRKPYELKLP